MKKYQIISDEMTIWGVPPLIFINHGLAKSGVDIIEMWRNVAMVIPWGYKIAIFTLLKVLMTPNSWL